jgi:4-oxalocrotonate tautomerase
MHRADAARCPFVTYMQIPSCDVHATSQRESIMPLVRIDLPAGKTASYRSAVGDVIYNALTEVMKAPVDDRFQVITEHGEGDLVIDRTYLGIKRTKDAVLIQITLNEGRPVERKQAFYKAVVDALHERVAMRREDVIINLVEVKKENWSYGNGEAQYVSKS